MQEPVSGYVIAGLQYNGNGESPKFLGFPISFSGCFLPYEPAMPSPPSKSVREFWEKR
jgi:hypothetical protein